MTTTKTKATAYDLTDWCDFARGAAEPRVAAAMQAALECTPRARGVVDRFNRVATVARNDRDCEIPAYALRVAKAAASVRRPDTDASRRRLPFSLIFDSLLQPATLGTRDVQTSHRLLSFRAGEYRVHVRLGYETNPHSQVVVGQVLRHLGEIMPVPRVPVLVLSGEDVVGRSLTSRFGEFQAADLPSGPLRLCVLPGQQERIDIPLGRDPEDVDSTT